jgi:hypothetical protein
MKNSFSLSLLFRFPHDGTDSPAQLMPGVWHQLVVTCGEMNYWYIDNQGQGFFDEPFDMNNVTGGNPVEIMRFKVYNRVLSSAEVDEIYTL